MNVEEHSGLYVHVPFCAAKCGYCSFNSAPLRGPATLDAYLAAVAVEIDQRADELARLSPTTLYFGGGTPTMAAPAALGRLREKLLAACRTGARIGEATVEANPVTLDRAKLDGLRDAGFDRLSLGVQSFDRAALAWLGSTARAVDIAATVDEARAAGFANLSLDLIVGVPAPHDTVFRDDLRRVIDLGPEHLSVYLLSLDEPAPLFADLRAGKFALPDGDRQADVFLEVGATLTAAGYEHYEVSNFARPGRRSRHNSAYWTGAAYAGFGAGAHSLILGGARPVRRANVADPPAYVDALARGVEPIAFVESLTVETAARERIMLALRTSEGLAPSDFPAASEKLLERLSILAREGKYTWDGARFRPTPAGFLVADGVAAELWDLLPV